MNEAPQAMAMGKRPIRCRFDLNVMNPPWRLKGRRPAESSRRDAETHWATLSPAGSHHRVDRLFKFASYCTGDYARRAFVVQIERIVSAKQTAGDRVGRNGDWA